MTLGAKASTVRRNGGTNQNGDDTLGSGFPKAQVFRGQGNLDYAGGIAAGTDVVKVCVARWSFADDGSPAFAAAGSGGMGLGVTIPANALITNVTHITVEEVTGPTNASLSLEADGDLMADGSLAANELDTESDIFVDYAGATGGVANPYKITTAAREPVLRFTVANATTGKVIWLISYIVVDQSDED